ncbi:MAG: SLC13 family permease [Clostridia bacterium]|nr:SLC13 family permease [Clostridia bacterium]
MKKMLAFFKGEMVLTIALIAALLSMLLIAPDTGYAAYVDWNVLMLLFALMAVVAGLKKCGVMGRVSQALLSRAGDARKLCLALSMACFFSAMLLTNDVALLTFVPLTAALLAGKPGALILTVSLETVAANLGSMATPIGNPQNLYLYTHYGMSSAAFFRAVLPLALASLVLVVIASYAVKPEAFCLPARQEQPLRRGALWLHAAQLALCLLSVFGLLPKWACFAAVLLSTLLLDRSLLRQVDYALLVTFVCFFVFVGNLGRLPSVRAALGGVLAGNELEMGILVSQIISNVPAALMLSGFTNDACALMRGVNLGGLGTLVASLASLISFKLYLKAPGARAARYLGRFTLMNAAFLAVLYALARLG